MYWRTATMEETCYPVWDPALRDPDAPRWAERERQELPLIAEHWKKQVLHIVLFDHNKLFGTEVLQENNYLGECLLPLEMLDDSGEEIEMWLQLMAPPDAMTRAQGQLQVGPSALKPLCPQAPLPSSNVHGL